MKKLSFFLAFLPYLAASQQFNVDSLDAFIAKQVKDYRVPGLAIGIMKHREVIFTRGYGVASTLDSFPVNTQTLFPICSCTKAFTAAALAVLVDEEKIGWDDKIVKYLPDFKLSDPWITKELTISDLLSHRSGLGEYDGDLLWYGTSYSRKEVVQKLRYLPVKKRFRLDFAYVNVMYLVAGMVIEAVSGKSYEAFVKEKLLQPLGMARTCLSNEEMQRSNNYARPHLRDKPVPLVSMQNIAPAGAVNATIEDMMQWMRMWIGRGRVNDSIIIGDNSYETITSIKTLTSSTTEKGYGFGWYIKYLYEVKELQHHGGMPGYKSSVILWPYLGDAIVILTNKISPVNEQLLRVLKNYLDSAGKINWQEADAGMRRKETVYDWDKDPEATNQLSGVIPDLSQYAGEYGDKVYGKAVIRAEQGKAVLELLPAKALFSGNLYFAGKDTLKVFFRDAFIPDGEVVFTRNAAKRINGFQLHMHTNDFHFEDLHFSAFSQ